MQKPFPTEDFDRIIFDESFLSGDRVTLSFIPTESTRVCVFVSRGSEPVFTVDRVRDGVCERFEK